MSCASVTAGQGLRAADLRLALAYAPTRRRAAVETLWSLDRTLGVVLTTTTQPMVGQLRLSWWHERLSRLGQEPEAGEPLLAALAHEVAAGRVGGPALAQLVEGWEALLDPLPLGDAVLSDYASRRGGTLFDLSARLLGNTCTAELTQAGAGWALADFAFHCSDADTAARAMTGAEQRLVVLTGLPRPLRILSGLARHDVRRKRQVASLARTLAGLIAR